MSTINTTEYDNAGTLSVAAECSTVEQTEFDYSLVDAETADYLRERALLIRADIEGTATRLGKALCEAQNRLSKHGSGTFESWYSSLGFRKGTVYNLNNRYKWINSLPAAEQANVEQLPLKLTYAAAREDAPEELVQRVIEGDIKSNAEYQSLLKEYTLLEQQKQSLDKQVATLETKVNELENRPADVVVEKQEVIPEGYISPEEHQSAQTELEKQIKKLSDEVIKLKGSQNAERTGNLISQIEELQKQLADQKEETTKAYGNASKAAYDSETKGKALEEAQKKNAELEAELKKLKKQKAEPVEPVTVTDSAPTFRAYMETAYTALNKLVEFIGGCGDNSVAYAEKTIMLIDAVKASLETKEEKS